MKAALLLLFAAETMLYSLLWHDKPARSREQDQPQKPGLNGRLGLIVPSAVKSGIFWPPGTGEGMQPALRFPARISPRETPRSGGRRGFHRCAQMGRPS
jgi:hypothetical protein